MMFERRMLALTLNQLKQTSFWGKSDGAADVPEPTIRPTLMSVSSSETTKWSISYKRPLPSHSRSGL